MYGYRNGYIRNPDFCVWRIGMRGDFVLLKLVENVDRPSLFKLSLHTYPETVNLKRTPQHRGNESLVYKKTTS